jgi:serine/threonine-protein kinase HipA
MSAACLACLEPLGNDGGAHHKRCLRTLFGVDQVPEIDVDLAKLHTVGLAMAGKTSLSGVQRKVSLGMTTDRATLQVALQPGLFILKPDSTAFPHLPANELLSMRLGELVGLRIPPCALVRLVDGSMAYIVRRFDRVDGRKVHQEDFCQLALQPPKAKYQGSAEVCARIVMTHASEPGVELLRLFRQLVFAWWIGNGDLHLKNLSVHRTPDGLIKLTPAYDLISTRLYITDDQLALPIGGKRDRVTRRGWLAFAEHIGIPRRAAERVLLDVSRARDAALELVGRVPLSARLAEAYRALLEARTLAIAPPR